MAENHLEYGYLEGESVGERFAEDPVGIAVFCVSVNVSRLCARRRGEQMTTSTSRALRRHCVCVCGVNGAFPNTVSTMTL